MSGRDFSDVQYQSFKDALAGGEGPEKQRFCVRQGPFWCVRRRADRCGVALLAIALLLAVFGATAPYTVDWLVDKGIDSQTVLNGPHGKAFTTFVESGANLGVKIYYKVSYLNLTNPEAVLAGRAKPRLQEVGPYIYHQQRRKLNVTFSEDGQTVAFTLMKTFVWDAAANEAAGHGLLDTRDTITTVHPVIQVLQEQIQSTLNDQLKELVRPAVAWLAPLRRAIDAEIDDSGLWKAAFKLVLCQGSPNGVSPYTYRTTTARDLYWGYHDDPVLLAMQRLVAAMAKLAARVGKRLPLPVVPEAFPGLQTNLTSEAETARRIGPNAVYTGQGAGRASLQEYTMFQNMTSVYACPDPTTGEPPSDGEMPACDVFQTGWTNRSAARHGYTPQWGSAAANAVRGTDGSMFAHPLEGAEVVSTFQEDYRRWVDLVYAGDVGDYHGMRLRRYVFSEGDFRNDSALAADFRQEGLPTGFTNLTSIGGFPLYLSKPHFLEADPAVQATVEGLRPDPVAHLTHIDVEPRSGVTFRTHKRVQLNAGVSTLSFPPLGRLALGSFLTLLGVEASEDEQRCMREKVTWAFGDRLLLPMVWYDEGFEMPPDFTKSFKQQVYGSASAAKTFQVAGPLLGVLLAVVAVLIMAVARRREQEGAHHRRVRTARTSTMQEDVLV